MNLDLTGIKDILNYNKIIISGHKNPDGDSIGSCLALALALRKAGKSPVIYIKELPEAYEFLAGVEMYKTNVDEKYDLFISLDSGDEHRLEEVEKQYKAADMTFNIDHHITNTRYAKNNYVFDISSTGEIIYHVIKELGIGLDKSIAEAIFLAVISDTGLYQYNCTTSDTYVVVSELMKCGIDFGKIIRETFYEKTYEQAKLFGKAFDNMEALFDGKVVYAALSFKDLKDINAKTSDTSGIVNTMMQIRGAKVAIFLYEPAPNNIKAGFRSVEPYNVAELAKKFEGGGHVLASGAMFKGKMEEIKKMILKEVKNSFKF